MNKIQHYEIEVESEGPNSFIFYSSMKLPKSYLLNTILANRIDFYAVMESEREF